MNDKIVSAFVKLCKMSQPRLKEYLFNILKNKGLDPIDAPGYLYAEGSVPILLTAHLDTVHSQTVQDVCINQNNSLVWSPQGIGGDDRCGVWIILEILKTIPCHVLFCEDEEIGRKGAIQFVKSGICPSVDFIFASDRRGERDVVFYDCDNQDFESWITTNSYFKTNIGSVSDISVLGPKLKTAAANFSSGYFSEHTHAEYVDIEIMKRTASELSKLIKNHKIGTFYPYTETVYAYNDEIDTLCEKCIKWDDFFRVCRCDIYTDCNNCVMFEDCFDRFDDDNDIELYKPLKDACAGFKPIKQGGYKLWDCRVR